MKRKMMLAAFVLAMAVLPAMAQDKQQGRGRDPKMMAAKMAEKMQFTDAQKAQVAALNAKYTGADYDKKRYRDEFHNIMTPAQKKQMEEWRAKRKEGKGGSMHKK